jgi:hypothetical protein
MLFTHEIAGRALADSHLTMPFVGMAGSHARCQQMAAPLIQALTL